MHREYHEFYAVHVYLQSIRISLVYSGPGRATKMVQLKCLLTLDTENRYSKLMFKLEMKYSYHSNYGHIQMI